jgi:hypothetical protein
MTFNDPRFGDVVKDESQEDEELEHEDYLNARENDLDERQEYIEEQEAYWDDFSFCVKAMETALFGENQANRLPGAQATVTPWQVRRWADSLPQGELRTWLEGVADAMAIVQSEWN